MSGDSQTATDRAVTAERQRALRTLLRHPLLTASGPHSAEAGLVRRHAAWLREWFARHPAWSLHVDSEVVRLRKTPADLSDGTRPARDPLNDAEFTRRRYVIFCLALAALERADRQTTLGRMAEEVVGFAAADPALAAAGIVFTLASLDQRRDLVHATRLLLDLCVLVRVHGDEQQFLTDRGDVLYNVNRPALAAVLNVKRGPSTVDGPDFETRLFAIVAEPLPATDDGRNRGLRSRLTRMLLDDPVVYYETLDSESLAYLNNQRAQIVRQIAEATGLIPEVRREGVAMVDDAGDATDIGLPEEGTEGHLALLLAEHLASHARREPGAAVLESALCRHTTRLAAEHQAHWRKSMSQPGAEVGATSATIDRLVALNLVRRTPGGVVPLPAIARYAVATAEIRGARRSRRRR
jgi:uncharacterized protein (TIGR02678 family)